MTASLPRRWHRACLDALHVLANQLPASLTSSAAINQHAPTAGSIVWRAFASVPAGLPPDPSPGYDSMAFNGGLGCPATNATHPDLDFRCQDAIFVSPAINAI